MVDNSRPYRGQEWDVKIPGVGTKIVRAPSAAIAVLKAAEEMHAPPETDLERATAKRNPPFNPFLKERNCWK